MISRWSSDDGSGKGGVLTSTRSVVLLFAIVWITPYTVTSGARHSPKLEININITRHPNITFLMYPTLDTEDEPQLGDVDVLLPNQNLTLVFHGFKGDQHAKSVQSIKIALLENGAENVVLVDWSHFADVPELTALKAYEHVVAHGVKQAAALTAEWLDHVMESRNITPQQTHLIGFSLGAHVAGMVGHFFDSNIARIYGLDPPQFGYEKAKLPSRLDVGDAEFVNVIHTSTGVLSYKEPIGHVDFYPNGDNVIQAGCPEGSPVQIITCSHYFAFAVFAESIYNRNAFLATQCESWHQFQGGECQNRSKEIMGYHAPDTTRGMYFIATNTHTPFGEEDVDNPLTDRMKYLITYDKNDSFVNPQDVVKFLLKPDPRNSPSSEESDESFVDDNDLDPNHKVMKVKGGSRSTTTLAPPAFTNTNSSSSLKSFNTFVIFLTVWSVFKIFKNFTPSF